MKDKLKTFAYVIGGFALCYIFICCIDVVCHNVSDYNYCKWNVLSLLFKEEESVDDTESTKVIVTTEEVTSTTQIEATTEITTRATSENPTEVTTEDTSEEAIEIYEKSEDVVEESVEPEATEVEPEIEEKVTYYSNEVEMLAHLINGEAGSDWCSDTLMYYVGSVVLNRMNHPDFPDSLSGVIYQDGQYSCTWDGNYDRTPSDRCYRIAEDLLVNGSVLPSDVVFQAPFEQGSGVYEIVQDMYFCYR